MILPREVDIRDTLSLNQRLSSEMFGTGLTGFGMANARGRGDRETGRPGGMESAGGQAYNYGVVLIATATLFPRVTKLVDTST